MLRASERPESEEGREPAHARVLRLEVAEDASWFRCGGGERVDLESRRALRGLLSALIDHHERVPGGALDAGALFACGWPGEHVRPESARNRLYVALSTLRELGLREVLVRRSPGWSIAVSTRVERARR